MGKVWLRFLSIWYQDERRKEVQVEIGKSSRQGREEGITGPCFTERLHRSSHADALNLSRKAASGILMRTSTKKMAQMGLLLVLLLEDQK